MFLADNAGTSSAAGIRDGRLLWRRDLNTQVRSSPMTYMLGGRQFVAVATGKNVVAFALLPAAVG